MSAISTSYRGSLGSLICCFRADARTVTALADLYWGPRFRRVWLDAARGVVLLRSPSFLHGTLVRELDEVIVVAAETLAGGSKKLRRARCRGEEEPSAAGLEPDCAFYVGDRAEAYFDALADSLRAAHAFVDRNAPDLVVEVEATHADDAKIERYAELGVRESWRIDGEPGENESAESEPEEKAFRVEFRALRRGGTPRPLSVSKVLPGLTPEKVCEAVAALRGLPPSAEQAIARIIWRRLEEDSPSREERAAYGKMPAAEDSGPRTASTSCLGPLGSTIHHLRLDAATVTALAGVEWSPRFRRVWLDPARESVVFLEPSRRHEDLTAALADLVETAAGAPARAAAKLPPTRWRGEEDPPDTGLEPDGSFYLGERAEAYRAALAESREAAASFLERNAPDLVVEVEMTQADEGKITRYADLGVRELWRLNAENGAEPGEEELRMDFLALRRGEPPRLLPASEGLPGLTPEDAAGAVEAVERIVRRCRRRRPHPDEDGAASGMAPAAGEPAATVAVALQDD